MGGGGGAPCGVGGSVPRPLDAACGNIFFSSVVLWRREVWMGGSATRRGGDCTPRWWLVCHMVVGRPASQPRSPPLSLTSDANRRFCFQNVASLAAAGPPMARYGSAPVQVVRVGPPWMDSRPYPLNVGRYPPCASWRTTAFWLAYSLVRVADQPHGQPTTPLPFPHTNPDA